MGAPRTVESCSTRSSGTEASRLTSQPRRPPFVASLRISLVVPVRNEEASLPGLISSIRRQTRAPDEIILVDGGSTDQTVTVATELSTDDPRFRILEAGEATPGRGRNV